MLYQDRKWFQHLTEFAEIEIEEMFNAFLLETAKDLWHRVQPRIPQLVVTTRRCKDKKQSRV